MTDPRAIVERYFAAFAVGKIDAAMACVHADAIWRVDGDPVVGTVGIVRGRDAVRDWLLRFPDSFTPLAFSVDRLMAAGDEVIALGHFRHRVVPTGAIVDSDYAMRFTIHDGLIARYQIFEDSRLIADAFGSATAARSVTINGTVYGWDDVGHGPPVLFLHGLFLDRTFWSAQTLALQERRRCIAFDMPGHGASGWRDGLDLDGIAADVALWIAEHCGTPVTIAGHSQGGMVAMRIAVRHPELVDRLVVLNTSARAEYPARLDGWRERRSALLAGDAARASMLSDVQRLTNGAAWREAHPAEMAGEHAVMMRHDPARLARALDAAIFSRGDIRDLLGSITMPVDVVSGALDRATPAALGEEIAELVPAGCHRIVADAAHHLPVEAADIVTRLIDG